MVGAYQVDTAVSNGELICFGIHAIKEIVDERAHLGDLVPMHICFQSIGIESAIKGIFDFGEWVFLVLLVFSKL